MSDIIEKMARAYTKQHYAVTSNDVWFDHEAMRAALRAALDAGYVLTEKDNVKDVGKTVSI